MKISQIDKTQIRIQFNDRDYFDIDVDENLKAIRIRKMFSSPTDGIILLPSATNVIVIK